MNEQTIRALNSINRSFYGANSEEFDRSRSAPWPGWLHLLPHLPSTSSGAAEPALRILDVGCGNGRLGAFLADHLPVTTIHYVGIDSSPALIARARRRALPFATVEFERLDLVEDPLALLRAGAFSLIALFGILHHVPSRARRRQLLLDLAERLAPGGILALTTWQFEAFERFRSKLIPWSEYNRSAAEPVDAEQLEPGDFLLPWNDRRAACRYCHFAGEGETHELLEGLGFEIVASYAADGREGNLNRYFICRFSSAQVEPKQGRKRSAAAA